MRGLHVGRRLRGAAVACQPHELRGPGGGRGGGKELGVKVVWYSTDYVFDGGGPTGKGTPVGPYPETAKPAPLNVYGSSKLAGEAAMLAADSSALVIRTNVVYGPEGAGKNFYTSSAASKRG